MKPPCFITLAFGIPMPDTCAGTPPQLIKKEATLIKAPLKPRVQPPERHHYPNTA